ncbi:hypothetical protein [Cellulomonas sp. P5_C5]
MNVALLWLINVQPGWEALPFLTASFAQVLPFVNVAILVGIIANAIYLVIDPPWLRALGDVVVTTVAVVSIVALWRTFPFSFAGQALDWELVVRILLGLGFVGSIIGICVAIVGLLTRRWRA